MRPLRSNKASRALLRASATFAAPAMFSGAAFAACPSNFPGDYVYAGPGDACIVTGSYATGVEGPSAARASGEGATISWTTGGGAASLSTIADGFPGVEADGGGSITLNGGPTNLYPEPNLGTVVTTGDHSPGLYATGVDRVGRSVEDHDAKRRCLDQGELQRCGGGRGRRDHAERRISFH